MPESPPNPDENVSVATERRIRWDAVAAIIAALIGLLALCVSGYTAYIQRQQVRAQVWPYLEMAQNYAKNEFSAINKGVGPVIVQSVQVLADGKPMSSFKALDRLFGFKPTGAVGNETLNGAVIAPGEQLDWISFGNAADLGTFQADLVRFHVEVRVCYASTLGESWIVVAQASEGGFPRPVPVSNCPNLPSSERFQD